MRRLQSFPATPGNTVTLTLDIKLQRMIEDLFGDRRGALVAIDPRSRQVLALVGSHEAIATEADPVKRTNGSNGANGHHVTVLDALKQDA